MSNRLPAPHRRQPLFTLCVLLCSAVVFRPSGAAENDDARQLAGCAAYYFNAENVRPLLDYDAIYRAWEDAMNQSSALVGREEAERLMSVAAADIAKLTERDWSHFDAASARFEGPCAVLRESRSGAP